MFVFFLTPFPEKSDRTDYKYSYRGLQREPKNIVKPKTCQVKTETNINIE